MTLGMCAGAALAFSIAPAEADGDWSEDARQCYAASLTPQAGVKACTRAIESGELGDKNLAITYSNRANSLFSLGRFEDAIADYDRALALMPGDAATLSNRGAAYTDMGQYAKALADFDKALEIQPRSVVALTNRCWARTLAEDFEIAVEDCNAALEVAPEDTVALISRSRAHLGAGDKSNALDDAHKAVKFGRSVWKAYYYRGKVLEALGRHKVAARDFAMAYRLSPQQPDVIAKVDALGLDVEPPVIGEGMPTPGSLALLDLFSYEDTYDQGDDVLER